MSQPPQDTPNNADRNVRLDRIDPTFDPTFDATVNPVSSASGQTGHNPFNTSEVQQEAHPPYTPQPEPSSAKETRDPVPKELQLVKQRNRRRLVGALAIALLVAAVGPLFFTKRDVRPENELVLIVPNKANAKPLEIPTSNAAQTVGAGGTTSGATSRAESIKDANVKGYAVLVSVFREPAKLDIARKKMIEAQISHFVERFMLDGTEAARLRAGPYKSKAEAIDAQIKLKKLGLLGEVEKLD